MPDHEVAPGLFGYASVDVSAGPEDGYAYALTATVEPRGGKYVVTRLVADQVEGGPPVQRGELAKISVEPLIREAAREAMQATGSDTWRPITPTGEFWDRIESGEGIIDEDLPQLAALYRWVRLQDGRPTAIMARDFKVSPATVRRWLSRAVEAGHLTQEERAK
ncbi:helix-turn-helix domain-containing protein [Rhodococcus rhodnii]|uniref:Helix-turn-helix domain-containing protein n=2 Tax=Rhodococcus rhodnii TaxID=38312 RepID=A0A6P2C9M8_9NOCA|nr:helix-turn-helix domain-containing protein [Rhodococcus rhodnii]TXG89457.1 helix-turn-helix domain-containing protein [Rhodococcus rhodnii]